MAALLLVPLVVLGVGAGVWYWAQRPPKVGDGTTLILSLSGPVTEREPPNWELFGTPRSWTTLRLWDTLRRAAADPRVSSLILVPESVDAGWATLAELHSALDAFARTGKPVVAYLQTPSSREYYLATAATRIVAPPGDIVNVKGLRVELLYARSALDKLGISPEFESIGRYKDGPDALTRRSMSAETKEVTELILDRRYEALINAIAGARRKPPQRVREILDEGPFPARVATEVGLLDGTEYRDELESALAVKLGRKKLEKLDAAEYARTSDSGWGLIQRSRRVAILIAEGDIARGSVPGLTGAEVLSPDSFEAAVRQVEQSEAEAVIVRINSPGGDAIASDELGRSLKRLTAAKPVIVSMGDLAASGGYSLAAAAGAPIVAYRETLTGSIGVFYGKLALAGLYEKLGIEKQILVRGRFAAIDSDSTPLTVEERRKLRSLLETMYRDFVSQVAASRKRSYEEVERAAQGRVWLGDQALSMGLVDRIGGIDVALALARELAGIDEQEKVQIAVYPQSPGLLESARMQLDALTGLQVSSRATVRKRLPYFFPDL